MKRIISALLAAVLLLLFAGCKSAPQPEPNQIDGVWKDSCGLTEYKFSSDGTMKMEALNLGSFKGTYRVQGSQITLRYKVVVKNVKETYKFRVDGDTLYLNNRKFRRKK